MVSQQFLPQQDMSTVYNANPDGSATLRFRKPGLHDVLSGRGGSVNSHPGNTQFREWVRVRKTEYNLAKNKDNKANICMDVIQKVYNMGGRFLVRDPSSNGWWVELEEERIMAKVSQALREGAPKIREAHRGESKRRQRSTGTRNAKRVRVDYNGHTVLPRQASPVMERPLAKIVSQTDAPQYPQAPPLVLPSAPTNKKLTRVHSLALSDISVGSELLDEFVDPFADEDFPLPPVFSSSSSSSSNKGKVSPDTSKPIWTIPPKVGILQREASVSSDLGGIGALFRSNNNNNSNHSNTHMDVFEQNWRPVSPEQI